MSVTLILFCLMYWKMSTVYIQSVTANKKKRLIKIKSQPNKLASNLSAIFSSTTCGRNTSHKMVRHYLNEDAFVTNVLSSLCGRCFWHLLYMAKKMLFYLLFNLNFFFFKVFVFSDFITPLLLGKKTFFFYGQMDIADMQIRKKKLHVPCPLDKMSLSLIICMSSTLLYFFFSQCKYFFFLK